MEKTPQNLIRETLAQVLTLPRLAEKPPRSSNEGRRKIQKPLKTAWQQKWLRLELVHPLLQEAADNAERFCGSWFRHDTNKSLLVLVGKTGCGKTHIAKSIFKFCGAASMAAFESRNWPGSKFPDSIYISWPEAAREFGEKNLSLMPDAMSNDLLILDDIGAENDPWKVCADLLCQILSRRERMFTVITTNVQPEEWSERFDVRISDRLFRNSMIVDLSEVPSYAMR
jgi:DNA replication protein DnaC